MKRLLVFLLILAIAGIALANLAGFEQVEIRWQDYTIAIHPVVLAAGFLLFVVVGDIVWRMVALFIASPKRFSAMLRGLRTRKMTNATHKGLLALALNDPKTLQQAIDTLSAKSDIAPISKLLVAVGTQNLNPYAPLPEHIALQYPTLALKANIQHAMNDGQWDNAHNFLQQLQADVPHALWVQSQLFLVAVRQKQWHTARDVLPQLVKMGAYTKTHATQWKAALFTIQALTDTPQGTNTTRSGLLKDALKYDAACLPAMICHVQDLIARKEWRAAAKLIETTWRTSPHPHLGQAYVNARAGDSAADKLARAHALAARNPDHLESALLLAQAALQAGRADDFLATLAPLTQVPTQRVCLLLHAYEHSRSPSSPAAREWLLKSIAAPADAGWAFEHVLAPHWHIVHPITGDVCLPHWHSGIFEGTVMAGTAKLWGTLQAVSLAAEHTPALLLE